jgi:hypothetical protein
MRLIRRETWCINDILSNCTCICLMAFPINQCCPQHNVMLTMKTFEKRKRLLILPVEMSRYKAEAIIKISENFIYGEVYYAIN